MRRAAPAGDPWPDALARWGIPMPDPVPLRVAGTSLPLVWRSFLAAAYVGAASSELRAAVEALGFALVALPERPGGDPPPELLDLLGVVR